MSDEYTPEIERTIHDAYVHPVGMFGHYGASTREQRWKDWLTAHDAAVKADAIDELAVKYAGFAERESDVLARIGFEVAAKLLAAEAATHRTPSTTPWPRTSPGFDTTAEAHEWASTTHGEGEG